jgi:hypothetical protein
MHTAIFMAEKDSLMRRAFLVACLAASSVGAQVTETPVPFDSAGRVRSLTPALVARFALVPPTWPAAGDFVAAQLFQSSSGGFVLAVERRSGAIDRFALNDADADVLRRAVGEAALRAGGMMAEDAPETISAPARRAFIRNQMLLGLLLYGPLLAVQSDDGQTATALYLIGAGGTYFAVSSLARNLNVTRAQNHLATDGALRGFLVSNGLLTALAGDIPDEKTVAGIGLLGSITASIAGFQYGRGLTDSEAKSATTMSSFAALTTLGALGAAGVFESGNSDRSVAGSLVAAGAAGYLMGPRYPRAATYTVTAGDVSILWIGAALGTAAAITPFVQPNVDAQVAWVAGTLGGLAGIAVADRALVRPYNHSSSDVTMMWLGTVAGALLGGAAVVLAEPDDESVIAGIVTTGGILGATAAHSFIQPARAGTRTSSLSPTRRFGSTELRIMPTSLALAATGVRGVHPLVTLRF